MGLAYLVLRAISGPQNVDNVKVHIFLCLKNRETCKTNKWHLCEKTQESMEEPHIGRLIRQELRRQKKTNRWFAEQINVNPRTVNKIFQKSVIDTHQLLRISRCLNVDFFRYYSVALK